MLVPHYLGDTTFPGAAVAALEAMTSATGLVFPTDELREENREFLAKIEEQVAGNPELQRLIETLEQRHDSYIRDNPLPSQFTDSAGNVVIPEDRVRYAMEIAGFDANELHRELRRALGQAWDDELEPFRHASDFAPVVWLHRVG